MHTTSLPRCVVWLLTVLVPALMLLGPATATAADWRDGPGATPGDRDSDGIVDDDDASDASPGPSFGDYVIVTVLSGHIVAHPSGIEEYETVEGSERLPFGSVIDTRAGQIELTSVVAPGSVKTYQSIKVSEGIVRVEQVGARGRDPYTQLRLRASSTTDPCPGATTRSLVQAARQSPLRSKVRVDARGKFQTRGRRSTSKAKGTRWLMEDYCDRTVTTVEEGEVIVTDLATKQDALITAPATATTQSTHTDFGDTPVEDDVSQSGCKDENLLPGAGNARRVRNATLCIINARRRENRLPPLRASADLREAAQKHSDDMVRRKRDGHADPDGSDADDRVARTDYGEGEGEHVIVYTAEILGHNYDRSATPLAIVRQWMVSEIHYDLILSREYEDIGIGVTPGVPNHKKRKGANYVAVLGSVVPA